MVDLLLRTLEKFNFPVIRQGSMAEDEHYPDHFFTFWNRTSDDNKHYDNKTTSYLWDFDVNFYSNDPEMTYTKLGEAAEELRKVGFSVSGKGHDVASDEATHTGRGITALFLEKGEN